MTSFAEVENWFAKNEQRLSTLCRHANFGKTADDLADGWVWVTLEAKSRIIRLRILNSGPIEGVLWDEASFSETDFDIASGQMP